MNILKKTKIVVRQILPGRARYSLGRLSTRIQTLLPPYKFSFRAAPKQPIPSPFPFAVNGENLLERLGEKYLPTKRLHNYLIYYWLHFRDIRFDVKNVLEIGIETDRSIRMWEEFFPNATIYGIDINPECKQFEGGRRRVFVGDQSDEDFLGQVMQQADGAFDIIIDDGSHQISHQLKSFDFLFPRMSEHGLYVMEDTGGCVDDFGLRTVNSLKTLVDSVMYWPDGFREHWSQLSKFPDEASWISKNIIGIAFYRWIVFVMRGRNPGDNPFLPQLTTPANNSISTAISAEATPF